MQWKEGQVSLSILEKFSSGFFLASQPAIPILDANPTHCQTASKILQGEASEIESKETFRTSLNQRGAKVSLDLYVPTMAQSSLVVRNPPPRFKTLESGR